MGQVVFEKGSKEWQMFQEFYHICEEYWIPEESDEYWTSLTDKSIEFCKKYPSVFALRIMLGFRFALDEVYELQQKKVVRKEKVFEEGSKEKQMFVDFYHICQRFWTPEDTKEYWDNLRDRAIEFRKKYMSIPLAKNLIEAVYKTFAEEIEKGKK